MSSYFYLKKMPAPEAPRRIAQDLPILEALGYELAEDIYARQAIPPYNLALKDGWAVQSNDSGPWSISSPIENGEAPIRLPDGYTAHINTGGALPINADCVVSDRQMHVSNGLAFTDAQKIFKDDNILLKGCEWEKDELLIRKGSLLGASDIALLSDSGCETVRVWRKPKIAILATGSEIASSASSSELIRRKSSNSIYLECLLKNLQLTATSLITVPDDLAIITCTLSDLAKNHDFIITIGGTGKGKKDLCRAALEKAGGILLETKVQLTDSLPYIDGEIGTCQIIGLPGNPLGFLSLTQRVLLPRLWSFYRTVKLPYKHIKAHLGFDIEAKAGEVCVELAPLPDSIVALPVMKGTGRSSVFQRVNGVMPNPMGNRFEAGSVISVELFLNSTFS